MKLMTKYIDAEAFKRKLIDEKGFFPAIVARALEEMPGANIKSEAYKEFWNKLKQEADFISGGDYGFSFEIREDVAEDIIKEMVGE